MKTSDFYYDLPKELIAQSPADQRDHSRMMLLNKQSGEVEHHIFYEIVNYLNPGDCLVLNNSRVIPARLIGTRTSSDGTQHPCELLLLKDHGDDTWECLAKPGRKLKKGTLLHFGEDRLTGEVTGGTEDGNKFIRFSYTGIFMEVLEELGRMPLPPYITDYVGDKERYQTVYSKTPGSAAAPTAGLHFTNDVLKQLEEKGVRIAFITLHVGLGTFRPVTAEDIQEHIMHSEFYMISEEAAKKINMAKAEGKRVIAVGTTSCRTLESAAGEDGTIGPSSGWTDIFIYPGYRFKILDGLLTNFHLPESTLIMLVSALVGRKQILNAYQIAVEERYRFFSFGDCMLIL